MKSIQYLFIGLLLALSFGLSAQTITFEENSSEFGNRTLTLSPEGQENGRNRYANRTVGDVFGHVVVRWDGNRWIITDGNDGGDDFDPGTTFVVYANNYDVGPNPPSFNQGNWEVVFAGEELLRLEGDGTQAVTLAWTLAAGPFTTDDGVQAGLGGGTPTGGIYSGPGVTDDGNGMTFSFDPMAAGVGTATISYGAGDNTVTQTIEVTQAGDVINAALFGQTDVLAFNGEVNGRNSYFKENFNGIPTDITISWSGERWEIFISPDNVTIASSYDVGPNPPDFTTGNWDNPNLSRLDGSGTQAVALAFTLDAGPFATEDGVQAGLGGGTPTGGIYSGPGVTDDGNGMTFSFDPAVAGAGMATISYGDGPDGANNVTQMVEVLDATEVCVTEQLETNNVSSLIPTSPNFVIGQSFTACATGRLTSITVKTVNAVDGELTLDLNQGAFTTGPDYSQTVNVSGTGEQVFTLDGTFVLVRDSLYAFSLTQTDNILSELLDFEVSIANPYAEGQYFQGVNIDAPQVVSDADFVFELRVAIDTSAVSTRPGLDVAVTTLTAFPNPTDGNFTVAYDLLQASDVTVVLYDAQGRKLRELPQGVQPGGTQRVNVERAGLASGVIYYGLITERGHSGVQPIVVR